MKYFGEFSQMALSSDGNSLNNLEEKLCRIEMLNYKISLPRVLMRNHQGVVPMTPNQMASFKKENNNRLTSTGCRNAVEKWDE